MFNFSAIDTFAAIPDQDNTGSSDDDDDTTTTGG